MWQGDIFYKRWHYPLAPPWMNSFIAIEIECGKIMFVSIIFCYNPLSFVYFYFYIVQIKLGYVSLLNISFSWVYPDGALLDLVLSCNTVMFPVYTCHTCHPEFKHTSLWHPQVDRYTCRNFPTTCFCHEADSLPILMLFSPYNNTNRKWASCNSLNNTLCCSTLH